MLFILTDDQQFDAARALGCEQIHTPQLDRLVSEGVLSGPDFVVIHRVRIASVAALVVVAYPSCASLVSSSSSFTDSPPSSATSRHAGPRLESSTRTLPCKTAILAMGHGAPKAMV